jgi:putative membrane protein insertion efficiency factor
MGKKIAICIVEFYRKFISPFKKPCCKYYPTCSKYAVEALSRYGLIKGGLMAVWRVLRCNPLSNGGFDPVK